MCGAVGPCDEVLVPEGEAVTLGLWRGEDIEVEECARFRAHGDTWRSGVAVEEGCKGCKKHIVTTMR
jgi:hypothetical protein